MMAGLRIAALLMAVAAVVDPAFASRRRAPLPIEVAMPLPAAPDFREASRIRDALLSALADAVEVDSGEPARAVIAVGHAAVAESVSAPVFGVMLPDVPRLVATSAPPVRALRGQQPIVAATFRGQRMKGQTTTFTMRGPGGASLASLEHRWSEDDETFDARFPFTLSAAGVSVVRISADTPKFPAAHADVAVSIEDRAARVFVYEPRPSWAAAFARQAIESDPMFAVRALTRTSRGIVTRTAGAPGSLAALEPDSADALLVGGLDALGEQDLIAMRRFAEERGGTVLLAPDSCLPEHVRRALALPALEESLLERPAELRQGTLSVKATELLRVKGTPQRDVVIAMSRGRGQVMLSAALDAWRFRGDAGGAFTQFWRAVAAEGAMAAVPAAAVHLDPAIVRPGQDVTLKVRVRTLTAGAAGELRLPKGTASIIAADGAEQPLRVWPGDVADEYLARFEAPATGRYHLRVTLEGLPVHDHVLIVDADAALPVNDRAAEIAFLAQSSGGSVIPSDQLSRLRDALQGLGPAEEAQVMHPTRSPWWMLSFAALLCGEWAMRRKRGLR